MKNTTVADLKQALENGALLLDVRETPEFNYEHIAQSKNIPRDHLSEAARELPKEKEIYVICQVGMSSKGAARTLEAAGLSVINVEGGLEAWKRAKYPVERTAGAKAVIPIIRQVQIIAGSMVLIGILAGIKWLALLAGAGLLFAGLSGTCMMASILSRCPWNRQA